MRKKTIFALWLAAITLSSCDDGPIYEEEKVATGEGRTVHLTGKFTGLGQWTDGYSVVLAGFEEGSTYATISKPLPTSAADGEMAELTLSGIKEDVTTVELCVINRLRERIVTFCEADCQNAPETLEMEAGEINVGMYSAIQQRIFNTTCVHCHGGSTHAAAGLVLTEGKSHAALVEQPSRKEEGTLLVKPGDSKNSLLHRLLSTTMSESWGYDHSKEVLSSELLGVIDKWIDSGAQE